ncbi:uncharacterized protein TNCV_1411171 [Trichonephila clavipes]|nr:uncharacterized protein TNCV_1411171 [Trichonephila clavipes]
MADVQYLKSALLYALKWEVATQASRRDRHSIRGARMTADESCKSRWIKEIEKLKEEMQNPRVWNFEPRKTQLQVLGMRRNGTPEKKLSPSKRKEENTISSSKQEN